MTKRKTVLLYSVTNSKIISLFKKGSETFKKDMSLNTRSHSFDKQIGKIKIGKIYEYIYFNKKKNKLVCNK